MWAAVAACWSRSRWCGCAGAAADFGGAGDGGAAGIVRNRPPRIEGGCAGGEAGPNAAGINGHRGPGGGIALIAKDALTISGTVHAGGAGGTGGSASQNGGGGGGSGGMIKLEASVLMASGILAANGGQGGGGCQNGTAGNGANASASSQKAAQGNSEGGGKDGGGGGFLSRPTGNAPSSATDGGGGGGAGVGYITFSGHMSMQINGTISPQPEAF